MVKETKENILDNLKKTLTIVKENEGISNRYRYYNRDVIDSTAVISLGSYIFLLVIVYIIINFIHKHIISLDGIFFLASLICIFGLPWYIQMHCPDKINKYFRERRIKENKDEIKRLVDKFNTNVQFMNTHSIVPPEFRNSYAIDTLIQYIVHQRVDNFKEALNLFERNQQHMQYMNHLRTIQFQQNRLLSEAQSTKEAIRNL